MANLGDSPMLRSIIITTILITWLFILPPAVHSQTLNIKFESFSIEDGMSFGNVYSFAQDSIGFFMVRYKTWPESL